MNISPLECLLSYSLSFNAMDDTGVSLKAKLTWKGVKKKCNTMVRFTKKGR